MKIRYPHIIILAAAIFSSFVAAAQQTRYGNTEPQTSDDGVVYDKYLSYVSEDKKEATITLEAYVEGFPIAEASDIVMVLDLSSSMDKKIDGVSRLSIMKEAAKSFVNVVYANNPDPANEIYHNLAIVGFNDAGVKYFPEEDAVYIAALENEDIIDDINGTNSEDGIIDKLPTSSGTNAYEGLLVAKTILEKVKDDGRPKTVVFFTDGWPSVSQGKFSYENAKNSINTAFEIKKTAAVFSVTLLSADITDDSAKENQVRHFQHYVSSNYPNKQITVSGDDNIKSELESSTEGYEDAHHYMSEATGADGEMKKVFDRIASESSKGGTKIILDENTKVTDILTDEFQLAEGDDTQIGLSVYHLETNGSTWTLESTGAATGATATISGKTVTVTGFNFTSDGNWVGNRSYGNIESQYGGRKLVITIPIKLSDSYEGEFGLLPTNKNTSGIYKGEDAVIVFPIPKLDYEAPRPSIGIIKNGLSKGESAIFKVQRTGDKNGAATTDAAYTIVLTGTGTSVPPYTVITSIPEGTYTISETSWAWSYSLGSITVTPSSAATTTDVKNRKVVGKVLNENQTNEWPSYINETVDCVLFIFGDTKTNSDVNTYAEAAVKNVFAGGSTTKSVSTVHSKE